MPPDFNFRFTYGYFSDKVLNTFDSTFSKPYYARDTVIKIILTKDEMKQIYKVLDENDYLDLPDTIISKECQIPHPYYYLEVQANTRKKTIYSWKGCTNDKNNRRFEIIRERILNIISSKKEIENIPSSNRIAL